MAQVNITLSEEEVLQVMTGDRNSALKLLLEKVLNELMKAESEEQLHAGKHQRSNERTDYRNGTRERELTTRIGKITLEVPRHRNEPFHTMVFENYSRSDASLIATMIQMVVTGVSTRKVEKVVETLCGESFSKSTVSNLCKQLDVEIIAFKNRSLASYDVPFLMVDATYFKARENGHIRSKAFLVALGINSDGKREILDFAVHDSEDNYNWESFFTGLRSWGLDTVRVVTSDAHKSIRKALAEVYPNAAWQRCQVHLTRNILDNTPNKYKDGLTVELRKIFNAQSIREARNYKNEIINDYIEVAPEAMKVLDEGFEDSMTIMCLPEYVRLNLRSTNIIEYHHSVRQLFPTANTGYSSRPGFLASVLSKSEDGVPVRILSQTYTDASGSHGCRQPQNRQAFTQFAEAAKHSHNCEYYVNPNLHAKFIIIDDVAVFCTTNFTPTQFIYLSINVKINKFEKIPGASYLICTLFPGHPGRRVFLCAIVLNLS